MTMSKSSHDRSNSGSWSRRKSLLALTALSSSFDTTTPDTTNGAKSPKTVKKSKHARAGSTKILTDLNHPDVVPRENDVMPPSSPHQPQREAQTPPIKPALSIRSGIRRGPSVFDSFRSLRSNGDDQQPEPLSAVSTSTTSSFGFPEGAMDGLGLSPTKTVVMHGEVQTSAGMFRKKRKEYMVLTETHILRYKSQAKAADLFHSIPHPVGRSPAIKHGQVPSAGSHGSSSDLQSLTDSYEEKGGRAPLRQVVATHRQDEGKLFFAIEIIYLDEESGQASSMSLQLASDEERDSWLTAIRAAVSEARYREAAPISATNLETVARIIERENDYDPANCAMFKCIQQHSSIKSRGSASSDDLSKVASSVCFLAIGVHKVHLIQVAKSAARTSSPALNQSNTHVSFGTLTLTSAKLSDLDDTFELTFRQPLQRPKRLLLASSASHEIAARLHTVENFLRPECGHRLFRMQAPPEVENLLTPAVSSTEEHSGLDRTLAAYCVAYGGNPTNVRYTINYYCEDAPRFELLSPANSRRPEYEPLELLAIMRALRYNESFGSISFAGVSLDALNGLHDEMGFEHVCSHTKRGAPLRLGTQELSQSCLLVQEVRAMAATSKKLRRLDFSGCITTMPAVPADSMDEESAKVKDIGCGIVEALFPLCKHQTTNVDWICLNGIYLSDTDMDYLVAAAVEKSCHFRAIELNRCGLNDRSMSLVLDALRAQENTLEAIQIAGNTARLNPATFDAQLGMFGFIRKLNLSYSSRTSGDEPLLEAETLLMWRLEELNLSGASLNTASIDAIATYLAHPQSNSLRELHLDNAYLTGTDIATLMYSMTQDANHPRELHVDISHNNLSKDIEKFTQAIAAGMAPMQLTMSAIEYREETVFRRVISALTTNKSIKCLNMSQTALPGDASEDTCRALGKLLAENDTLIELDMSGEDSRLATSKFGPGFNQSLAGLKFNETLQTFRIEKQRLGMEGANMLADVLKENGTLRELYCDNNEIPLQGLTDLVNSFVENTTLVYLPSMDDGRAAAFKSAEQTMKGIPGVESPPHSPQRKAPPPASSSAMKRGFASVRRSATRSAAAYTPSFPALPKSGPSPMSTNGRPTSSGMSLTLPSSRNRMNPPPPGANTMSFTAQDIQTTQRLLTEQWDRQCFRLSQYLNRNWCLLNNVPVNMEIDDEKFERPKSAGSLSKMMQQTEVDATPRAERTGAGYFESGYSSSHETLPAGPPQLDLKIPLGSKSRSFFVENDSNSTTPEEDEEDDPVDNWKTVRDGKTAESDGPSTPTQEGFF